MQSVKFRAWDKKKKRWIPHGFFTMFLLALSEISIFSAAIHNRFSFFRHIGLHDRNGDEIYEGDILFFMLTTKPKETIGQYMYMPAWDECRYIMAGAPILAALFQQNANNSVVVGNCYEHRELLDNYHGEGVSI